MSKRQVSIAVDAVGGEQSPFKNLKGSEIFQKNYPSVRLIFFGNKKIIEESIIKNKIKHNKKWQNHQSIKRNIKHLFKNSIIYRK